ncbi:hypothetical protein [Streptomyces lutosisoli]|uniref:Uncharacterized protein n=1 Tax=Streptomyces lutosisoli TaxID=2665721 RepID=A0ABW2VR34_9ACTN
MLDRPSQLPEHLVAASAGRRMVPHSMRSVLDRLGKPFPGPEPSARGRT